MVVLKHHQALGKHCEVIHCDKKSKLLDEIIDIGFKSGDICICFQNQDSVIVPVFLFNFYIFQNE